MFLQCTGRGKWNVRTSAHFRLHSARNYSNRNDRHIVKHIQDRVFHSQAGAWGFIPFAEVASVANPESGFLRPDGSVRVSIDVDTSEGCYSIQ